MRKLRNTSRQTPLTPDIQASPADWQRHAEFVAAQQTQIAELCKRLAGIERRFNGQQQRIGKQETFIAKLEAEGKELRTRLRFIENSPKLKVSEAR